MRFVKPCVRVVWVLAELAVDLVRFAGGTRRSRTALAAENLFLRRQRAFHRERQVKPRQASDPVRFTLVLLARCFAWREALPIVQPGTLLRWHRAACRLFWRWRSRPGRPRLPAELQRLITRMARDNPSWGRNGLRRNCSSSSGCASPRTVRRYLGRKSGGGGEPLRATRQRWAMVARNHAQALVACGFCVVVTATFRVLRTPGQAPVPNCYCERLLGTLRRECLDYLIRFGEDHLRQMLCAWRVHYNRDHPHAGLGPGLPEPLPGFPAAPIVGHDLPGTCG